MEPMPELPEKQYDHLSVTVKSHPAAPAKRPSRSKAEAGGQWPSGQTATNGFWMSSDGIKRIGRLNGT